QIDLIADAGDKVTENFTGKERDDETELNYFGARYLDPMLGLWISVDPKRQFASPYLYAGNGVNPIGAVDPDGSAVIIEKKGNNVKATIPVVFSGDAATADNKAKVNALAEYRFNGSFGKYNVQTSVVEYNPKIHGNTWNNINLLNEGSPKCGSSGSCVENRALPGQAYINVNNVHSIIHEFGHLLGLDDKYDSQYMGSGATYKIDSVKHWDHGYIYRVWNSLDSIMLQINLNERSLKRFSSTGYLTKEFVIDTIIVDEEIWNNRNLKRNTIVLEAPRRPENRLPANVSIFSPEIYFPFVVKFVCYRDFDDFFSCEDMVSAARVNHNCLDVKKYKFAK
ncbi:MAG: hypothetical protein MJZ10_05000, partial [Fibrobacter sp.]|nr:hypothetical protein [Fibrobacter sp.]